MIGRMRPFYQAHWDISKDIKHVWLLICTYYIAWIFQWILSGEGRGKWWDRQYRVWIPQCAAPLDVTVTYARDSFVDSPSVLRPGWHMQETALWIPRGAFCPLEQWFSNFFRRRPPCVGWILLWSPQKKTHDENILKLTILLTNFRLYQKQINLQINNAGTTILFVA